jgi:hypothetical protein
MGLLATACSQRPPIVWSAEARSPDGQWVATARSDQFSGPGNAAIVSGVYLRHADGSGSEQPVLHFLDELPPEKGGIKMRVIWVAPTHLEVTFDRTPKLNLLVAKFSGIDISVRDPQNSLIENGATQR